MECMSSLLTAKACSATGEDEVTSRALALLSLSQKEEFSRSRHGKALWQNHLK